MKTLLRLLTLIDKIANAIAPLNSLREDLVKTLDNRIS